MMAPSMETAIRGTREVHEVSAVSFEYSPSVRDLNGRFLTGSEVRHHRSAVRRAALDTEPDHANRKPGAGVHELDPLPRHDSLAGDALECSREPRVGGRTLPPAVLDDDGPAAPAATAANAVLNSCAHSAMLTAGLADVLCRCQERPRPGVTVVDLVANDEIRPVR